MAGPEIDIQRNLEVPPLIFLPPEAIIVVQKDPGFSQIFGDAFLRGVPDERSGKSFMPNLLYSPDPVPYLKPPEQKPSQQKQYPLSKKRPKGGLQRALSIDSYSSPAAVLSENVLERRKVAGSITELTEGAEADAFKLIEQLSQVTAGKVFNVVFGVNIAPEHLEQLREFLQNNKLHAVMAKPASQEEISRFATHFANVFLISEHAPDILQKYFTHQPEGGPITIKPKEVESIAESMLNTADAKIGAANSHMVKATGKAIISSINYFTTATTRSVPY